MDQETQKRVDKVIKMYSRAILTWEQSWRNLIVEGLSDEQARELLGPEDEKAQTDAGYDKLANGWIG